ncbi:MAG: hypothetical protein SOT68_11780 [Oscillospiraceae bacterium]|nr:hypothetical protein [Oscillospiraceae bacterium]MDY2864851.1 hypothetical protein [Oscillospiraceae bacterium]
MKIRKLIPIIMCALCLTACADIPEVRESIPEDEQTVIAPPENGWTAEELAGVSYFDGVQLSYPITLRSLGSAYGVLLDFKSSDGDTTYSIGKDIMSLDNYANIRASDGAAELSPDTEITEFWSYSENISVNGIKVGADKDAVISALGEPDSIEDGFYDTISVYSYLDRNTGRTILEINVIKENGCVTVISLGDK